MSRNKGLWCDNSKSVPIVCSCLGDWVSESGRFSWFSVHQQRAFLCVVIVFVCVMWQ